MTALSSSLHISCRLPTRLRALLSFLPYSSVYSKTLQFLALSNLCMNEWIPKEEAVLETCQSQIPNVYFHFYSKRTRILSWVYVPLLLLLGLVMCPGCGEMWAELLFLGVWLSGFSSSLTPSYCIAWGWRWHSGQKECGFLMTRESPYQLRGSIMYGEEHRCAARLISLEPGSGWLWDKSLNLPVPQFIHL